MAYVTKSVGTVLGQRGSYEMVTLILVVCLSGTPGVCHEEQPPIDVTSAMSCLVQGQQLAAEWLEEHPKWRLEGWRCRLGPREKQA